MDLYLLRHAQAGEHDPEAYPDDSRRPITEKGRRKTEKIAGRLLELGVSFDLVITSPYLRATQTTDAVRQAFGRLPAIEDPLLAADADPADFLRHLRQQMDLPASVLLVGHEPFLGELAGLLLFGRCVAGFTFKKSGIAKFRIDDHDESGRATLQWLLTPRLLLGEP